MAPPLLAPALICQCQWRAPTRSTPPSPSHLPAQAEHRCSTGVAFPTTVASRLMRKNPGVGAGISVLNTASSARARARPRVLRFHSGTAAHTFARGDAPTLAVSFRGSELHWRLEHVHALHVADVDAPAARVVCVRRLRRGRLLLLGSWVGARRPFHLSVFLTASRMILTQVPSTAQLKSARAPHVRRARWVACMLSPENGGVRRLPASWGHPRRGPPVIPAAYPASYPASLRRSAGL